MTTLTLHTSCHVLWRRNRAVTLSTPEVHQHSLPVHRQMHNRLNLHRHLVRNRLKLPILSRQLHRTTQRYSNRLQTVSKHSMTSLDVKLTSMLTAVNAPPAKPLTPYRLWKQAYGIALHVRYVSSSSTLQLCSAHGCS